MDKPEKRRTWTILYADGYKEYYTGTNDYIIA